MLSRSTQIAALAVAVTAVASAFAARSLSENDAVAAKNAKVTLIQAVSAAEQQHADGHASKAEFEQSKSHGWVWDVEVVSGAKVFDVQVDAQKGTVISSTEDKVDGDDEHDERD